MNFKNRDGIELRFLSTQRIFLEISEARKRSLANKTFNTILQRARNEACPFVRYKSKIRVER